MGMMEYFFMYHFKKRGVLYEQENLQCFGNCCHVDNFGGVTTWAANVYTLDGIEVDADRQYDKFGNVITEQSYSRTGGDVTVITRQDIEKKHFQNITDAVKRVPGVHINDMGYHGGEYGFAAYSQQVTINGDGHVVVLLDGRRLDNAVSNSAGGQSSSSGNGSAVPLHLITNIGNVESIEVIKGPGASVYGGDASGGVINIITRKGQLKNSTTVDLATGSWNKHTYGIVTSGSNDDGKWRYFGALNREMSGDTHYKDGEMGKSYKYYGTRYKDDGASVRLDRLYDEDRFLSFSFNYTNNWDGYPVVPRDYKNVDRFFSGEVNADAAAGKSHAPINPGFRNKWWYHGVLGDYTTSVTRNMDVTWQFKKDNELPSYIRFFHTSNDYGAAWVKNSKMPGKSPSGNLTPDQVKQWLATYTGEHSVSTYHERSTGVDFQFGKTVGLNNLLWGITISHDYYRRDNPSASTKANISRNSITGYLQDKIKISDKFEITPGVRYIHASDYTVKKGNGADGSPLNSNVNHLGMMLSTQYKFNSTLSAYGSWAQIFRAKKVTDYDAVLEPLDDEKGNVYNVGLKKSIGNKSSIDINYSYLGMDNAIASYSIEDSTTATGTKSYAMNAKQNKRAFNIGYTHQFNDNWNMGISYSYVKANYHAKNIKTVPDGSGTSLDDLLSKQLPINSYQLDVGYTKGKFSADFLTSIYSGNDTAYFTNNRFVVSDLTLNYKITDSTSIYFIGNNLWNTAWENRYFYHMGKGAFPQPGRSFMIGVNTKF